VETTKLLKLFFNNRQEIPVVQSFFHNILIIWCYGWPSVESSDCILHAPGNKNREQGNCRSSVVSDFLLAQYVCHSTILVL